jgi:hypothetical protein
MRMKPNHNAEGERIAGNTTTTKEGKKGGTGRSLRNIIKDT